MALPHESPVSGMLHTVHADIHRRRVERRRAVTPKHPSRVSFDVWAFRAVKGAQLCGFLHADGPTPVGAHHVLREKQPRPMEALAHAMPLPGIAGAVSQ